MLSRLGVAVHTWKAHTAPNVVEALLAVLGVWHHVRLQGGFPLQGSPTVAGGVVRRVGLLLGNLVILESTDGNVESHLQAA
jgi:hypothetical protein